MRELQIAVFAEDRNFLDFLVPAIECVAEGSRRQLTWLTRESLHGCRGKLLRHKIQALAEPHALVVVGADAQGRGHARRGPGHRRKRKELLDFLQNRQVVVAVADPCVEAWMYCDPNGFAAGLERGLGVRFLRPPEWPRPQTEAEAKGQLAQLVRQGLQDDLVRNGFEFAREIVTSTLAGEPTSPSLQEFLGDLRRMMGSPP